ncbi:MAG: 1-acyl-sn-glycerol-3-phosphate acyltransferase [Elusimicrobia bacterium]|nr:1-acyl-sn-glycerol-3-phosphate acyltransferase [Elusimicrobiota bacterium]
MLTREAAPAPRIHFLLRPLARLLFTVYNDIRVHGAEHIPAGGPVIVASNHPTYLDPAFLMVGIHRSVRFMAWEKPFRVPLLGRLMRAYGAVPVDMKKPGKASFAAAVRILRSGEAFGIFPEGGRTKAGQTMNPFKSGVARLALITGAPIVPATITGGRDVWPKHQFLPSPGPIRVTFHEPIRVAPTDRAEWRRDRERESAVVRRVLDSINSTLGPALRAEQRMKKLWHAEPKPPILWVEGIPFYVFAFSGWWLPVEAWLRYVAPAIPALVLLVGVLVVEQLSGTGNRTIKAARHLGPWIALLLLGWSARGVLAPWELAVTLAGLVLLAWVQVFRFSSYRRLRAGALLLAYLGWLVRLKAALP